MDKIQSTNLKRIRLIITVVISVLIFSLLIWDYFHGGVPRHHLLNQKNLPAISNWWGAILLPVLSWILLSRIKSRIEKQTTSDSQYQLLVKNILMRFAIGLIFAMLLSFSFVNDYKPFLDNVLYIILVLSFFIPIFFSEFMLGFILGMSYTFGAILPTAFILIIAAIGFIIYKFIRSFILKLIRMSRKRSA
ncbi:MAG TPA: hypothetical protein VKT28_11650 [Puia sp.]|nr:hypothetical protein [Puia sp.]